MGVFAKVVAKRSFFGAAQEPHGAPGPTQGRIAEMVTPTIASFGTVGMSPLGRFCCKSRLREATKRDSVVLTRIAARSIHDGLSEE
jgi:hypothetical protein